LAQLETGHGNISIIRLRRIAHAMGMGVERLAQEKMEMCLRWRELWRLLEKLKPERAAPRAGDAAREIWGGAWKRGEGGLRWWECAGRGSPHWARCLRSGLVAPFIELDRRIEQESGVKLSAVFDLYGPAGFHRLEREALERVLETNERFVLATGGSIVNEPETFSRLRSACYHRVAEGEARGNTCSA